ncbi:hypothetical protein VSR01_27640 [Actinacidiphila sp. DG2A-62]|uniref:hypothetical protein n=1 Tax=Actinacidiphila sp. DG2A-62 TaxID=3108821 RepID=UPI002DBF192A|nr:hypothetical protein [Actinacidiphila sp. DG2A-62]MEC3997075.1 hypothetical protein [Actinacidiphila sp. DG2A-62]
MSRVATQIGGAFGVAVLAVILHASTSSGTVGGFQTAFWCATGFAALGTPLSFLLPRAQPKPTTPSAAPQSATVAD